MYWKWKDSKREDKNKVSVQLIDLHFSNDDNHDKTDKSYKIRPVIEHLNKVFAESQSNSPFQNFNEHMPKFKVDRVRNNA